MAFGWKNLPTPMALLEEDTVRVSTVSENTSHCAFITNKKLQIYFKNIIESLVMQKTFNNKMIIIKINLNQGCAIKKKLKKNKRD